MVKNLKYNINKKEILYFYIRAIISIILYFILIAAIVYSLENNNPQTGVVYILYSYAIIFGVYFFFRFGILIGHIRSNSIKLSGNQFPEIFQIVKRQSELLGLKSIPGVYIMQSGGLLNAFAARFMGSNYVVLYSDILDVISGKDTSILEFIIGHELGHIKRNHMLKKLLLSPSYLIPFLGAAYSRACEYTCDQIGYFLCPSGVKNGLLLFASGKTNYHKVNLKEYLYQGITETGFWVWFAEKVSSHPSLINRLALFNDLPDINNTSSTIKAVEVKEEDHSKYMPR